jgi:hypothetical protein
MLTEVKDELVRKTRSYTDLLFMLEVPSLIQDMDCIQRGKTVLVDGSYRVIQAERRGINEIIFSKYGEFDMDVFLKHYNRKVRTWCNETKNKPDEYPIGVDEFLRRLDEWESETKTERMGLEVVFSEIDRLAEVDGVDRGTFIARNPEWRDKIREAKTEFKK